MTTPAAAPLRPVAVNLLGVVEHPPQLTGRTGSTRTALLTYRSATAASSSASSSAILRPGPPPTTRLPAPAWSTRIRPPGTP